MVPQVHTVIDGYKKIVEKLIHESDHFAPTPNSVCRLVRENCRTDFQNSFWEL